MNVRSNAGLPRLAVMMRLEKHVGFFVSGDGLSFGIPAKRPTERVRHIAKVSRRDGAMPCFGGGDAGLSRLNAVQEVASVIFGEIDACLFDWKVRICPTFVRGC